MTLEPRPSGASAQTSQAWNRVVAFTKEHDLNEWLQIIGTFGVVLSLVFVGMQLSQNQQIAAAQIYQARAALKMQNFALEAASPVMQEGLRKAWVGEPLTENETRNVNLFFYSWLAYWENNYYQHQRGMMRAEQWASSRSALARFARVPHFERWWKDTAADWPESFRDVVQEVVREVSERE